MNKQEINKEDILRQYLDPEKIEKVPQGFTLKVMNRIQLEKQPSAIRHSFWRKNSIPLVSCAVVILLMGAAFLIPVSESDSITLPVLKLMKNIKSTLPELNFSSVIRPTLSSVLIYVSIGLLVLTLFDRALYGIFHREK